MGTVRAKFKVDEVRRIVSSVPTGEKDPATGYMQYKPGEVRTIIMSPVYGNGDPNHENTKFWAASPSGRLELGCANLAAAEAFEIGKEYYIDFTPAD